MARKKGQKLDFSGGKPLKHNPFAALGNQFGITTSSEQTEKETNQETSQPQPMLMLRLEKRKGGHLVTCIYHLCKDHKQILKKLKGKLGCGGTVQDQVVQLQGDRLEQAETFLIELGYKVRIQK